jgi:hypothetical protein
MLSDAIPALLRIRSVAALVLHRAGYGRDWIAERLGGATPVEPTDITEQLLTGAAQYLRDAGFTYWRIPDAVSKLRDQITPPSAPAPEAEAWGRGLLFDLAGEHP